MAISRAPLFLYGTLCHIPLLEAVLGRPVRAGELRKAVLPGAAVTWVAGQPFPMIALNAGAGARGITLDTAREDTLEKINFYEGGFDYTLTPVTLEDGTQAQVYVPGPEVGEPGVAWSLEDWARDWGALSVEAAQEVMSHQGTRSPHDVARMFPSIRKRAASRLRAKGLVPVPGTYQGQWVVQTKTTPYSDFFKIDDYTLQHERFDGSMTEPLRRAVFVAMDAALVLPYDPVRDVVLLVEQFRMGPMGRGDPNPWQIEPIAGHVDPGETPQEAARREAMEEAGLELGRLETIAEAYPAPGAISEFYYVYIGITDIPDVLPEVSGLESEGENLRSHVMSFEALMALLEGRQAGSVPLALSGYWLSHHRARLRAEAGIR